VEPEKFPSDPFSDPSLPPETGELLAYDKAIEDSLNGGPPVNMRVVGGGSPVPDWGLERDEPAPEPNDPLTEVTEPSGPGNVFVHRDTGTLIKIVKDDGAYITYAALDGTGRYSMPRGEYDAHLAESWRPAESKDLAKMQGDLVVPRPAGAPPDWR
jgi:hypothetical protein